MSMNITEYYYQALQAKHWAAASDVLRLMVLWRFGGCYVDSDVEIVDLDKLKSMMLLAHDRNEAILGLEDAHNVCGAVIIAPPKHKFITRMLDVYAGLNFSDTFEGSGGTVNGTTLLTREAHGRDDVRLEQPPVFHPVHFSTIHQLSLDERRAVAKEFGSTTLHHFNHSWGNK